MVRSKAWDRTFLYSLEKAGIWQFGISVLTNQVVSTI